MRYEISNRGRINDVALIAFASRTYITHIYQSIVSLTVITSDCVGGTGFTLQLGRIEEFGLLTALLGAFIDIKVLILALDLSSETQKTNNQ